MMNIRISPYPQQFISPELFKIFSAYIFRGQDLFDSFLAAEYPVWGYAFYFYFVQRKTKIKNIEKIIFWVGMLFIIAFLISFVVFPTRLFQYNKSVEDRGFQRILLTGSGFLFLLTFLALNKLLVKRTLKWTVILLLCYLCVILSLTRVYILSTGIISLFYIWKKQNVFLKTVILAAAYIVVTIVAQLPVTQRLLTKTQDDTEDIQDYIRFQSAQYYLTDFQPSIATLVLGNGFTYGDKTDYGRQMDQVQKQGFYVEDLGFLGLYIYMGILAIIAYIIIFYRSYKIKLPQKYFYLKMYVMFIFLNGVTNSGTFSESAVLSIVFTLYLFDAVKNQEKLIKMVQSGTDELNEENQENQIAIV